MSYKEKGFFSCARCGKWSYILSEFDESLDFGHCECGSVMRLGGYNIDPIKDLCFSEGDRIDAKLIRQKEAFRKGLVK